MRLQSTPQFTMWQSLPEYTSRIPKRMQRICSFVMTRNGIIILLR